MCLLKSERVIVIFIDTYSIESKYISFHGLTVINPYASIDSIKGARFSKHHSC